jgi:hypothetical protein
MRNFEEGLKLYAHFRGNPNLKRLFMLKGATAYNTEKLEYELRNALQKLTQIQPKQEPKTQKPRTDPKDLAQASSKLQEERKVLLQEAAHLHSRLDIETDEDTRNNSCEIIYFNSLRINQIHRLLEYAVQHGELPDEPPITRPPVKAAENFASFSEAKLIRTRNNLRSQASKNKNNPPKLQQITDRLKEAENLLSRFNA